MTWMFCVTELLWIVLNGQILLNHYENIDESLLFLGITAVINVVFLFKWKRGRVERTGVSGVAIFLIAGLLIWETAAVNLGVVNPI